MSIRTLLVDNDTIYRSAVRCIFDQVDDVTVVGEARVTESLVPILARVNPDGVVVGVPADVGAGFTATLDIRVNAPGAGIVVLADPVCMFRLGVAEETRPSDSVFAERTTQESPWKVSRWSLARSWCTSSVSSTTGCRIRPCGPVVHDRDCTTARC